MRRIVQFLLSIKSKKKTIQFITLDGFGLQLHAGRGFHR